MVASVDGFQPVAHDDGSITRTRQRVAVSTVALLICSYGPTTYLLLHVFTPKAGGFAWVTVYPFTAVAIFGVVALSQRLRVESPRDWPFIVFAVGGYVTWALVSAAWSVSSSTTSTNALIGI